MEILPPNGPDSEMGARIKRLLKEAELWCRAERGRQSRLAEYLGVAPQHISVWFAESKKENPKRQPTGEQALALDAFLKYQQGDK